MTDAQERSDWRLAAERIREVGASSVLDVGCFDGAFFDHLDRSVERLGIEINPEAARRARERGVDVIASDLHELLDLGRTFECIVAFDVIEHVHSPAKFLRELAAAVTPGGHVIVATGTLQAPTHRFMGSKYLYSWYQEHIAFISEAWLDAHAESCDLSVVQSTRFSHRDTGKRGFTAGVAKNALYRVASRLIDSLRASSPDEPWPGPPAWSSARDHMLVLLRKNPATHDQ